MTATLLLARHGRAEGMHPDAGLTPEGEAAIRHLAGRLRAEAFTPGLACCSPYLRARRTLEELLLGLGSGIPPLVVPELIPDAEADEALAALRAHGLGEGRVLAVSHMPLVSAITRRLTGEDLGFAPGQALEITLEAGARHGRIVRRFPPSD